MKLETAGSIPIVKRITNIQKKILGAFQKRTISTGVVILAGRPG